MTSSPSHFNSVTSQEWWNRGRCSDHESSWIECLPSSFSHFFFLSLISISLFMSSSKNEWIGREYESCEIPFFMAHDTHNSMIKWEQPVSPFLPSSKLPPSSLSFSMYETRTKKRLVTLNTSITNSKTVTFSSRSYPLKLHKSQKTTAGETFNFGRLNSQKHEIILE